MNRKKYFLNFIASYIYDEYLESINKKEVIDEFLYSDGFVYVKDNVDSYGIRVSFENNRINHNFLKDLRPYLDKKKVFFVVNGDNKSLLKQLEDTHYLKYASYEFVLEHSFKINQPLPLKPYTSDEFDDYIRLLGSFSKMREELNLEPFDWYFYNQDEAKKKFQYHSRNFDIYGYWHGRDLLAVGMMDKNDIDTIAVDVHHQRKGIGTKMLTTLISMMNGRGFDKISLSSMTINQKAIKLYKSVGFEIQTEMHVLESKIK